MRSLRRFLFSDTVRQTGVALADQVVNSAANFVVGITLIRGIAAEQYGLFVLANAALFLAIGFQHAIVAFPMTVLAAKRPHEQRLPFVDALATGQFALWLPASLAAIATAYVAADLEAITERRAVLITVTATAAITVVAREFFRQVFFLFRRTDLTLAIDVVYGLAFVVFVGSVAIDLSFPAHAAIAAAGAASALASGVGAILYGRLLGGRLRIDVGALRATWAPAKWGVPGMLLAWLQNQGFFYLLGAVLGTKAVATVSASRLLLVPIPMMLTAIESVLRPRAADWIGQRQFGRLTRQLLSMSGAATVAALAFTAVVFALREPIVEHVLKKSIADLDLLLLCWGIVFVAQVLRTNITVLLQALERFDVLFYLTLVRAAVSFTLGYAGMLAGGAPGMLVGLAVGEVVYVATGGATARGRLREAAR